MREILIIFALTIVASILAIGQTTETTKGNAKDEEAIKQVIANWDKGWKEFDAQLATQDYAEDADWTNAFGVARKGRSEIHKFLADTFTRPDMRSRRSTPSTVVIRFVRPGVAVITSKRETVGQGTVSGGVYPTRKTHDLRVMVKEKGGWLVVSHLIMDEKEVRQ